MARLASSFDFILSTIPQKHDLNPFIELLKRDCTLCVVGALEPLEPVNNMQVAFHRRAVAGSLIGNLADTQEVLDFCAKHEIGPYIELIDIEEINDAYDKVEKAVGIIPPLARMGRPCDRAAGDHCLGDGLQELIATP
jgi:uncharacterized zinc-type alcohol dehydrogenase-like protein